MKASSGISDRQDLKGAHVAMVGNSADVGQMVGERVPGRFEIKAASEIN